MQAKAENIIKHTHYKRGPENRVPLDEYEEVIDAYRQAVVKGILKVMGKMGISTLQSYKGAQIFEAIGLSNEVIEKCFDGTVSKIKGISLETIQLEDSRRHSLGWPEDESEPSSDLPNPGDFHWRSEGEKKGGIRKQFGHCSWQLGQMMTMHIRNFQAFQIKRRKKH